jgi:haloalkane dehalogenase
MPVTDVLDTTMHHTETGAGAPVVLLHGNPTSSHAWRNVIPRLGPGVRALAPDLVGMGRSGKPDIAYRFADHARYLDAWFDALGLDEVVLVGHDWGGALAFDRAARHPDRVRGLAVMETIVRPLTWDDFPNAARPRYEALRGPAGDVKVLEENFFIEKALHATVRSGLAAEDHAVYAAPYPTPESRRPLLAWPREMPIEGEPADLVARIEAYDAWLATSPEVPKLLLTFDGSEDTLMIGPEMAGWCADHITGLEIVGCGPAAHIVQEDQPEAIGDAIDAWLDGHGLRAGQRPRAARAV